MSTKHMMSGEAMLQMSKRNMCVLDKQVWGRASLTRIPKGNPTGELANMRNTKQHRIH